MDPGVTLRLFEDFEGEHGDADDEMMTATGLVDDEEGLTNGSVYQHSDDEYAVKFELEDTGLWATGDEAVWSKSDEDIPEGEVGEYDGYDSEARRPRFKFAAGTWSFDPNELTKVTTARYSR